MSMQSEVPVVPKEQLRQWLQQWRREELGIPDDPHASPRRAREKLLQAGIKPERNELSALILLERKVWQP